MRHQKSFNHLGRKAAHREAMLSNMAASLIMHKKINTTLAKAKALRSYVEPLITRAKEDTTHNRRTVFSYLQNKEAVTELFRNVSQKIQDRPGGYTRILKTGSRPGDNAEMCLIELVDYNEMYLTGTKAGEKAKTRRSRTRKKAEGEAEQPVKQKAKEAPAAVVTETPQPEAVAGEGVEAPQEVAEVSAGESAEVQAEEAPAVTGGIASAEPETPAAEEPGTEEEKTV